MNRETFIHSLKNHEELNSETLKGLTELVDNFPYCAASRMLFTLNLIQENHFSYQTELEKTAVFIQNRSILKHHIDQLSHKSAVPLVDKQKQIDVQEVSATDDPLETLTEAAILSDSRTGEEILPVSEEIDSQLKITADSEPIEETSLTQEENKEPQEIETDKKAEPEKQTPQVQNQTSVIVESSVDAAETIENSDSDLAGDDKTEDSVSFKDEKPVSEKAAEDPFSVMADLKKIVEDRLKTINEKKRKEERKADASSHTDQKPQRSKQELVDHFIKSQPSISRPAQAFFNPVQAAKESVVDEESIVSETLAKIYFDQGQYTKSIKIYQKLSLKFPEKSSYFAALIKIAEEEIKK